MPYRRKKLTFAISSPDEFLSFLLRDETLEKLSRSRIEVTPTALLHYLAYTHWTLTFDLNYDLELQFQASYGHEPYTNKNSVSKSVGFKCRVETNRRTDGQTDGRTLQIALPSRLTRSVTSHSLP